MRANSSTAIVVLLYLFLGRVLAGNDQIVSDVAEDIAQGMEVARNAGLVMVLTFAVLCWLAAIVSVVKSKLPRSERYLCLACVLIIPLPVYILFRYFFY